MSWVAKLHKTYQQAIHLNLADNEKLVPIGHTLQNAHINIVLDVEGNFKRARVLDKTQIILPATEKSAGRSSGEAPHPLADKLQYVAKDYTAFGGLKKNYFYSYKSQLLQWCASGYAHPKVQAIFKYIDKGQVIEDLIQSKIIYLDAEQKLCTSWPTDHAENNFIPALFKLLPKTKGLLDQGNALVCWSVEIPDESASNTWEDPEIYDSWIKYINYLSAESALLNNVCFVTGEVTNLAVNHPAKIRHTGDKAKLISSNDNVGFTFLGRFIDSAQAAGVGSLTTQKAHNALRWLITRQGYRNDSQIVVAWAVSGKPIPQPLEDPYLSLFDNEVGQHETEASMPQNKQLLNYGCDLGQSFALQLNKAIAGYKTELKATDDIVVMAIDAATTGRMSITYYREFLAKKFIERLASWYLDFAWPQRYTKPILQPQGKRSKTQVIWRVSTPTPRAIAEAAYGKSADYIKKNVCERLMPCIIECQQLPLDLINACIRRATNPNSGEYWEWEKSLGIACALFRGYHRRHSDLTKRRDYSMSLEENNTSRDYLYGRLLAIADRIEEIALSVAGEKRSTTAIRFMQRFSERPYSTWRNIELALQPYMQRLQSARTGFLINRQKDLDAIFMLFNTQDFINDKSLSGEFLLAFHCQRQAFRMNENQLSTEK